MSSGLSSALSTVSGKFSSIYSTISSKMSAARDAVGNAISALKSKFNFSWSLPHLKLPHVSISGSFSINPPSVPHFGISWYKDGGILTRPTIFGAAGNNLLAGGEAGAEAVVPLATLWDKLETMITSVFNTASTTGGSSGEGLTSTAGRLLTLDDFSLGSLADSGGVVVYYDFSGFTWSPQIQTEGTGDDADDFMAKLKAHEAEGLAFSYEQVADENTSTEDKKTTNERGTELFPLSFTTVLHSGAGVDVWAEIQSWKALVTKVNYFYLGGKKLGPKLQLRKVAVSNTKVDGKGRLLLATLSFTFKEYDPATTSVKVSTTALNVKASTASKSVKKTTNTAAKKATKKTIKVGDYVKPTGSRYATGQKIPNWVKQRKHRVSQIKSSQNKVLLGHPNGINSWVYLSEVTLA